MSTWIKNNIGHVSSNVLALLALGVSLVSLWTTYQLQGMATISMVGYSSNYGPQARTAPYLVTIDLRNAGPAVATDMDFGLIALDGSKLHAVWLKQAVTPQQTVEGSVLVTSGNIDGLTGDPTSALTVWVTYHDGVGRGHAEDFLPLPARQAT